MSGTIAEGRASLSVIGGGAWGTALSVHLARLGHPVGLWIRESELVDRVRQRRDNPTYLPGIRIPETVTPHASLEAAIAQAEAVFTVVPTAFARGVYAELGPALPRDAPVVVCTKGIEEDTLMLPLEVAGQTLGHPERLAVLSGPSFAREVAEGRPTAVVVASENNDLASRVQRRIASPELRVYTNADPVGVQVSGALKNVIAIGVGIGESLGLGTNARAALITRGLAEISRLVTAVDGRAATASGLAGLGDLVLTCTGDLSRNLRVGRRLGRGERLEDIQRSSRAVAEGVRTAVSALQLARSVGAEMPIVEEVHRILFEDGSPDAGLKRLLNRPLRSEA